MSRAEAFLIALGCCVIAIVLPGRALGFQLAANAVCATAQPIAGEGLFDFDNTGPVTADRPRSDGCGMHAMPEFLNDVWFCWTSACDGDVTVDTCGTTTVDTKLEVWAGCDCNSHVVLGCDDNTQCGMQSRVTFSAVSGEQYLIRLATSSANYVSGGTGQFTIRCAAPVNPPCDRAGSSCALPDPWNALVSDQIEFVAAARFTPAESGTLSTLCWWGVYFDGEGDCSAAASDAFEVRYYADAEGIPGVLLAGPFTQLAKSLAVQGPARTNRFVAGLAHEFEYSATHEPVAVEADTCYWVEISNPLASPCAWMWEGAYPSAGRAIQDGSTDAVPDGYGLLDAVSDDLAFCTDVALSSEPPCQAPANDLCMSARPIFDGETTFTTVGATTDGPAESLYYCRSSELPCCYLPYGDSQIHQDVWFEYVATCSGLLNIDACGSNFDTKLAMYAQCPTSSGYPEARMCNDDWCGEDPAWQSQVSLPVTKGQSYILRVGGFREREGTGVISLGYCHPRSAACTADCSLTGDLDCDGTLTVADYPPFPLSLTGPCEEFVDSYASHPPRTICLTGPPAELPCDTPQAGGACCSLADFDYDGDRDLRDFGQFQRTIEP